MTEHDLPDLRRAQEGAVLTLTRDRPAARNAYSEAMVESLVRAIDEAEWDDGVRWVVLTGAGTAFWPNRSAASSRSSATQQV